MTLPRNRFCLATACAAVGPSLPWGGSTLGGDYCYSTLAYAAMNTELSAERSLMFGYG